MSRPAPREAEPRGPEGADGGRRGGWAAVDLLRRAVLRLHHAYEAVPRDVRRRWWVALGTGFVVVELFTLAVVWAGRWAERSGLLGGETWVLQSLEGQTLLSFNLAMWMEAFGNGFILWALMLFCAGVAAWWRRPLLCLSFLVGYTGVYLPIATAWLAWSRERPTLIAEGIGSPGGIFHSYPSGHVVQAVFAYGLLIHLWIGAARRRAERGAAVLVFLLLVAVVAVGRLRIGAHWPSDIAAGLVIGSAWLAVVVRALRAAELSASRRGDNPAGAARI